MITVYPHSNNVKTLYFPGFTKILNQIDVKSRFIYKYLTGKAFQIIVPSGAKIIKRIIQTSIKILYLIKIKKLYFILIYIYCRYIPHCFSSYFRINYSYGNPYCRHYCIHPVWESGERYNCIVYSNNDQSRGNNRNY